MGFGKSAWNFQVRQIGGRFKENWRTWMLMAQVFAAQEVREFSSAPTVFSIWRTWQNTAREVREFSCGILDWCTPAPMAPGYLAVLE
jgi:hypothetical protein